MKKEKVLKNEEPEFFRPDYKEIHEDLREIVQPKAEPVEKVKNIVYDGSQYAVRFPAEIVKIMNINTEDKIKFIIKVSSEQAKKRELIIEYLRREDDKEKKTEV